MRKRLFRYVCTPDHGILYEIGIYPDGTIRNPRQYPEEIVRKALDRIIAEDQKRRSDGAKKAAVTRKRRQAKLILQTAKRIVEGAKIGPRTNCVICGRGLGDPESIARGIGSECWQSVLVATEKHRDQAQVAA
jgi:Family of unknown function (DUF6011)